MGPPPALPGAVSTGQLTQTRCSTFLEVRDLTKRYGDFTALGRYQSRYRRGRVRLLPRALGLRQDHAAARHRRPRSADLRHHPPEGARRLGAAAGQARLRHRLPVLCAVPQPHRHRQCRLRAGEPPAEARRHRQARRRASGAGRAARLRPEISRAAVGRPAAARGARSRARDLARPAAARRAAVGARCARAPAPAPRDQGPAAAARRHHHHGDARPGRGAHHGRPHRGDEPGRHRAGRHAAGNLPPAGHRLRRRLRGLDELPRPARCWPPTRSRSRPHLRLPGPGRPGVRQQGGAVHPARGCARARPAGRCRQSRRASRWPSSISSAPSAAPP